MLQLFSYKIQIQKLFPLGAKRENTPKKGPPKQRLLWGPLFFVPDTRGLEKNLISIHPQDEGPRGTTFK